MAMKARVGFVEPPKAFGRHISGTISGIQFGAGSSHIFKRCLCAAHTANFKYDLVDVGPKWWILS